MSKAIALHFQNTLKVVALHDPFIFEVEGRPAKGRQAEAVSYQLEEAQLCDSREVILNCNRHHHQLLNLLGKRYIRLYANSA